MVIHVIMYRKPVAIVMGSVERNTCQTFMNIHIITKIKYPIEVSYHVRKTKRTYIEGS